jgi:hypothetical protein
MKEVIKQPLGRVSLKSNLILTVSKLHPYGKDLRLHLPTFSFVLPFTVYSLILVLKPQTSLSSLSLSLSLTRIYTRSGGFFLVA